MTEGKKLVRVQAGLNRLALPKQLTVKLLREEFPDIPTRTNLIKVVKVYNSMRNIHTLSLLKEQLKSGITSMDSFSNQVKLSPAQTRVFEKLLNYDG
jgi:hypothetical protein